MSGNALLIIFGLLFVGGIFLFSVLRLARRGRVPYWESLPADAAWWTVLGVTEAASLEEIQQAYGDRLKAVPKLARPDENEAQRRQREAHMEAIRQANKAAREAKFDAAGS